MATDPRLISFYACCVWPRMVGGSINRVGACVCVVDENLHRGGFHGVDFDFAQVGLDHVMGKHGPAYFFCYFYSRKNMSLGKDIKIPLLVKCNEK